MKRLVWANLLLGIWLMISPFVLRLIYPRPFVVTWEDCLFGFAIAAFSLGRLFASRRQEIMLTDWFVTTIALLTLLNPLLYNYQGIRLATWNNLLVGGVILICAGYLDWKDSDRRR